MLENEFEKKVQEHLEEFRLRPSGEVWTNVEKELRGKKRRRVIFFLFMLAGLGLAGYSGYTWWSNHDTTLASTQNKATPPRNTDIPAVKTETLPAGNTTPAVIEKTGIIQPAVKETQPVISTNKTNGDASLAETAAVPVKPVQNKNQKSVPGNMNGDYHHQVPVKQATANEFAITVEAPTTAQKTSVSKEEQVPSLSVSQEIASNNAQKIVNANKQELVPDSAINNKIKKDSAIASAVTDTKETPVVTAKKKQYPKITWGPDLSTGFAFSRSTLFSFDDNSAEKALDALQQQPSTNVPANGSVQLPSSVKPGMAFKAGVTMELKMSKRSSILSGLRYSFLSEKIKVGNNVAQMYLYSSGASSSISLATPRTVYRGTAVQPYTNRYHFLELPLLYQLQLNKGKKVPVLWNAGLSASYLLSTNALIYDTTARGIYYKDKKAFNRFHMGVETGLSVRLGKENKVQWVLGPEFSFDLSKQIKQPTVADKRYLFYGGITGRMFFAGKKK